VMGRLHELHLGGYGRAVVMMHLHGVWAVDVKHRHKRLRGVSAAGVTKIMGGVWALDIHCFRAFIG
jgi:hypothetical protein